MKKGITVVACAVLASMSYADITSVSLESTGAVDVNLTTEGATDWVMLGRDGSVANRDEKSGVDFISAVTVSGTHDSWAGSAHQFGWTDGNPLASATGASGDWEAKPLTNTDQYLSFSVDGLAVGDYSMMLYASSYKATQELTATLGVSSQTATHGNSNDHTVYAVGFSIDNLGDSMDIVFSAPAISDTAYGNIGISAITIAAVPEPATLGLITAIGGGLLFIRRRFMI
ncbi:PEP-CTERM sorting domain-containing protein [Pontiellaceae bacterium B1224]|nr:PEP-CTERM sorting domain-containing protein [Pontiellaceae bacterium B1224]